MDIKGHRFGKLVAVELIEGRRWKCVCDCGRESICASGNLRNGHTRSCGCLAKSVNGLSRTLTHKRWLAMKQRCYDQNTRTYPRYGGRGILVCDEWKNDFLCFLRDMGPCPSVGYSLDRVDNEKGYSPQNCRWIPKKEQAKNTSTNVIIFWNERRLCLTDWAKLLGIKPKTMHERYRKGRRLPELFNPLRGAA